MTDRAVDAHRRRTAEQHDYKFSTLCLSKLSVANRSVMRRGVGENDGLGPLE